MQEAGFWDNPAKNAQILQKRREIERRLQTLNQLRSDADELDTWRELLAEAAERGWVGDPEEIVTELNYLAVPRAVRRSVNGRKLEHARNFIAKSARNMRALLLDPVANLARREDFPMIDRPRVCRRCNFRRLCFPRAVGVAALAGAASA